MRYQVLSMCVSLLLSLWDSTAFSDSSALRTQPGRVSTASFLCHILCMVEEGGNGVHSTSRLHFYQHIRWLRETLLSVTLANKDLSHSVLFKAFSLIISFSIVIDNDNDFFSFLSTW